MREDEFPRALPWQSEQWRRLGSATREGRLPHALLVAGAGREHFCRALAAFLLCRQPVADSACETCRSCGLLRAGTHTDFLELRPREGSRQIKVEQIRGLGGFLAETAALGERKAVLIEPAEAMNPNAANALLKSLEEPSDDTYLLLAARAWGRLPATVASRCQRVALPLPGRAAARQWLLGYCEGEAAADEALRLAGGRPLLALRLAREDCARRRREWLEARAALGRGELSPQAFQRQVADAGVEATLGLLADGVRARIRELALAGDRRLGGAFALLDKLQGDRQRVRDGANPNPQLGIEAAAVAYARALGGARGRC